MTFQVTVRWHPNGKDGTCTSAWFVQAIRGGTTYLVLEDVAGIEVSIPLAYIEFLQMERKG